LIYFLKGELPWQNLTIDKSSRRQVIGEIKKNIPINQITAALPDEFATYLAVVRKLDFHEKPNYILLRQLFRKCFHERRYQDGNYDWTKYYSPVNEVNIPVVFPMYQSHLNTDVFEIPVGALPEAAIPSRKRKTADSPTITNYNNSKRQDQEWVKKPRTDPIETSTLRQSPTVTPRQTLISLPLISPTTTRQTPTLSPVPLLRTPLSTPPILTPSPRLLQTLLQTPTPTPTIISPRATSAPIVTLTPIPYHYPRWAGQIMNDTDMNVWMDDRRYILPEKNWHWENDKNKNLNT
jgi:hypothetical protein